MLATQNGVTAVRATALPTRVGAAFARPAGEEAAMSELDRLEAAMNECREMIREAHAATKDLRAAVREARQELRALARDEVAAQIRPEVSRQLEELGERTGEAITAATQKVIAEFDRFGESLLGKETYWQKASGRRAAARPGTDVMPPGILPETRQRLSASFSMPSLGSTVQVVNTAMDGCYTRRATGSVGRRRRWLRDRRSG